MKYFLILIILTSPLLVFAQKAEPIVDAWEPIIDSTFYFSNASPPKSIFLEATNYLISFYKKDISTGSVNRCPFAISCSSFLKKALKDQSIFGLFMFFDRYFYRENLDAFSHYKLIQTNYGVLKLDDGLFLFED